MKIFKQDFWFCRGDTFVGRVGFQIQPNFDDDGLVMCPSPGKMVCTFLNSTELIISSMTIDSMSTNCLMQFLQFDIALATF